MTTAKYRSDMTVELLQAWGSDEFAAKAARVSTGEQEVKTERLNGPINYLVAFVVGWTLLFGLGK